MDAQEQRPYSPGSGEACSPHPVDDPVRARFEALPQREKDRILDEHRYINVDSDFWSECILSDFIEDLETIGIQQVVPYWSGFCSQGDGACFKGVLRQSFWAHYLPTTNYTALKEAWAKQYLDFDYMALALRTEGWYYHEGTMYLDEQFGFVENPYDEDEQPLPHIAFEHLRSSAESEFGAFCKDVLELCRDKAHELYKQLEAEYYYQTSDEQVLESLIASEILEGELDDLESNESPCDEGFGEG